MKVTIDSRTLPLEMLGTGCLQAIQLVAYTTMYNPTLLLLDEPNSHLHPSNQRLLAETLMQISNGTRTKVILSTHSRHLFDAMAGSEYCEVVWMKEGVKQAVDSVSDLSILLDLGALDSFERISSNKNKVIVLTEDTKNDKLKLLLEHNGFKSGEYFIQPLHGVENLPSAYAVADFFTKLGPDTHVLVHRDGDTLLDEEKSWLATRVSANLPARSTLFITPLSDVEHQFCKPAHIASVFDMPLDDAMALVEGAITKKAARLAAMFSSKRQSDKDRVLRKVPGFVEGAQGLLLDVLPFEYAKGKELLGQIIQDLNSSSHDGNRLTLTASNALTIPALLAFSAAAWAAQPVANEEHSGTE